MALILYSIPVILAVLYKTLERYGFWDFISGRDKALSGLVRLKNTAGFPRSWIYNRDSDKYEFEQLLKRIRKNSTSKKIIRVLESGYEPTLITVGGNRIPLTGVPDEWNAEQKSFYSQNHPVMLVFEKDGKADVCCTLGELEKWIDGEKKEWDFWLGVIVLSAFTLVSIFLRFTYQI